MVDFPSGGILAKMEIWEDRGISNAMNLWSTANTFPLSWYSTSVTSIFYYLYLEIATPFKFKGFPLSYSILFGWLFPKSTINFFSGSTIPALRPVSIAVYILSPVIIISSIPESFSYWIDSFVSAFKLFSKDSNPKFIILSSNSSLEFFRYCSTSLEFIALNPIPRVRYPWIDKSLIFWSMKSDFWWLWS